MIKLIGQFQCTRQQADANTVNVPRQATVSNYNKTGNKVPFYCSLIDQLLTLITLGVRVVLLSLSLTFQDSFVISSSSEQTWQSRTRIGVYIHQEATSGFQMRRGLHILHILVPNWTCSFVTYFSFVISHLEINNNA